MRSFSRNRLLLNFDPILCAPLNSVNSIVKGFGWVSKGFGTVYVDPGARFHKISV
jgi:hypothetical protein